MQQLLTTHEIAKITGKSLRAVQSHSQLDKYLECYGEKEGPGRPPKLFKPEVLSLWNKYHVQNDISKKEIQKEQRRADYMVPRIYDSVLWQTIVRHTRENFLSMPVKNLKEAVRQTVTTAAFYGHEIDGKKVYNKLKRNKTKTSNYRSPFYSENWNMIHDTKYKVKDNALNNHAFNRYNLFGVFRSAGLLGKGYGSRRVIVVDDFKRDVWVEDEGEMKMQWGLLFIDGITNFPLACVPTDSINTDTVAYGILKTAFENGIHEDTVWVFETSHAMNNNNVRSLIKSFYSKEQLEAFKSPNHWVKQLFPGQTGPYVNSPAMIAQSIFKSKVERSIKNFKDGFDAVYNPTTYQGRDRDEGVQLTLKGNPLDALAMSKPGVGMGEVHNADSKLDAKTFYSERLLPAEAFWARFENWVWGKYIQISRRDMYKDFKQMFNFPHSPSILEVHNYFTSENDGSFIPDMNDIQRFAYVLYYAQTYRHKYTVKIKRIGQYTTTINNNEYHLRSRELNESHVGLKVCTIPINKDLSDFIVMDVTRPEDPEFICIAHDVTVRRIEDVRPAQIEAQQMREENTKRLREIADSNFKDLGDDFYYQSQKPQATDWIDEIGSRQSKLIGNSSNDEDEIEEVQDVEEVEFKSKAIKDMIEKFDLDDF